MTFELIEALHRGALEFNLTISQHWTHCCALHFELLQKWQRRVSLSSYRTLDEYARWGYLEGLVVAQSLAENTVIDVGAGAGFPGVAMSAALPETAFIWLEPQRKRWAFLKEVVRELKLENVSVVRERFEEFDAPREALYFVRALDQLDEQLNRLLRVASERRGLAVLAGSQVRESLFTSLTAFEINETRIPTADNRYFVVLRPRQL